MGRSSNSAGRIAFGAVALVASTLALSSTASPAAAADRGPAAAAAVRSELPRAWVGTWRLASETLVDREGTVVGSLFSIPSAGSPTRPVATSGRSWAREPTRARRPRSGTPGPPSSSALQGGRRPRRAGLDRRRGQHQRRPALRVRRARQAAHVVSRGDRRDDGRAELATGRTALTGAVAGSRTRRRGARSGGALRARREQVKDVPQRQG